MWAAERIRVRGTVASGHFSQPGKRQVGDEISHRDFAAGSGRGLTDVFLIATSSKDITSNKKL